MPSVNDKRAVYRNYCTPLEFPGDSDAKRWFLDSDCGRKLTGSYETSSFSNGILYGSVTADGSISSNTNDPEFVCLKINLDANVKVSLDNTTTYTILIQPNEAIAFEGYGTDLSQIAHIKIAAASGTPNVEYYVGY